MEKIWGASRIPLIVTLKTNDHKNQKMDEVSIIICEYNHHHHRRRHIVHRSSLSVSQSSKGRGTVVRLLLPSWVSNPLPGRGNLKRMTIRRWRRLLCLTFFYKEAAFNFTMSLTHSLFVKPRRLSSPLNTKLSPTRTLLLVLVVLLPVNFDCPCIHTPLNKLHL